MTAPKVSLATQHLPGAVPGVPSGTTAVRITYHGGLVQNQQATQRASCWIIDRSGSMSRSMPALNRALKQGWQQMRTKPYILPFNTTCKELPRLRYMAEIRAEGGTSFQNALLEFMDCVNRHALSGCDALFFTDGHDNGHYTGYQRGGYSLTPFLKEVFWPWMRVNQINLHVIGFSDSHDIDTMKLLIEDPQARGVCRHSFQYAADESALNEVIARVAELAKPTITFEVLGQRIALPVEGGEATFFVQQLPAYRKEAIVRAPEADFDTAVVFRVLDAPTPVLNLALLGERIRAVALEPSKTEVQAIDAALTDIAPSLVTLKRDDRKQAGRTLQAYRESLAAVSTVLAKGVHASTGEKARVLQTAATIRTQSSGYNKQLDMRVLKNEDLRTQIEAKVDEEVKALALAEQPTYADKYTCLLSCTNWFEALQDKDCMCVPLVVTRPPSAIGQPAHVRVHRVNYQCMTMEAFKMALDTGILNYHNEIEAHGGFDASKFKATVIRDRAIMPCNAVFPLFLDSRHWRASARHYMKLALGWMATLDERGYAAGQWQTIPLLIYGWFLTHGKENVMSVHKEFQARVGETVYRMLGGDSYLATLKTQLSTPNRENVPNLLLLFAGAALYKLVLTAAQMQAVYVEEVRRMVRTVNGQPLQTHADVLAQLQALLHLNEYIDVQSLLDWDSWTPAAIGENVMPTGLKTPLDNAKWVVPYLAAVNDVTPESLKDVAGAPFYLTTLQRHAVLCWALWHCRDDKERDADAPDPMAQPEACLRYFVGKVKADWEERKRHAIQKAKAIAAGNAYVTSYDETFHYSGHHLFNGKDFKNFLHTVRRLHHEHAPPGTLVNARAKYAHLCARGWKPAAKNKRAFESQFV